MRRKFRTIFPFFVAALLAQLFAPIGAGLSMAATFDARMLGLVCIQVDNADHSVRDDAPAPMHVDQDCCDWCHAANAPAAPLHPALIGLPNPPALYLLVIQYARDAVPSLRSASDQTRARAPPHVS